MRSACGRHHARPDSAPPQILPPPLVVRHGPSNRLPVVAAVAAVAQMYQLVDDDIVHEAHRGLDDAPVQPDGSVPVAASPAFLLVRDDHPRYRDAGLSDRHAATRSGNRSTAWRRNQPTTASRT